ncbi:hypothetical protein PGIGA_G00176820 [Pangasianodon gigas]|uniref:Uncharacterized protein n=1 Tax=Pangasianodon gigas TaxID=30993 RepID=A0ACC5XUZ0_PANGG|nr:hypothetical protein [Pangasianodon gigas]
MVTFSVATDAGCYDSGVDESETPSSKSSKIGVLSLPEDGYERTTPEDSVGEEEHVENDSRQLPDVALTGKCTRDCGEYGHSDTCWMPVQSSPRQSHYCYMQCWGLAKGSSLSERVPSRILLTN